MKDINLEESKIRIDDKWLSMEEIAEEIQQKIQAGDMKVAAYASALEKLTIAVENSQLIDVRLRLTKEEYSRLKNLGKGSDAECVRKAVRMFITRKKMTDKQNLEEKYALNHDGSPPKGEPDTMIGKCVQCKTSIEIPAGTSPEDILCPKCTKTGEEDLRDSQIKFKDHFLG